MKAHLIAGGGGLMLHVVEAGPADAPPILFLHGFNQSVRAWQRQFGGPLARAHRLVAMDLRGHGCSEAPPDAYGAAGDWADDVASILDALALERPVLVAWSYAGVVALDFIRIHGAERLAGLNLVSAVSKVGRPLRPFLGAQFLSLVAGFYTDDPGKSAAALRRFVALCFATPPEARHVMAVVAENMSIPPHVRRGLFARRLDNDDLLPRLDLPVLVTHGARDPIVLQAMAEHHAERIPNARLSLYADSGHSPFFEDAARFDEELAAFMARCPRSASP